MTIEETGQGENNNPQGGNTGINPAWNDLLALVPEDQHSQAQQILADWDKGIQDKFTARAEEIKPYKSYIENKVDPQELEGGRQLLEAVRTRPEDVFKALAESIGTDQAQQLLGIKPPGETVELPEELKGLENHPFVQDLKRQLDNVNTVVAQSAEERAVEAELDKIADEIATGSQKHFERDLLPFEEQQIITSMLNGMTVDKAFEALKDYHTSIGFTGKLPEQQTKVKPPAPNVLGGQGGVPQGTIDPRKITDSQRKHNAVELLRQQNAANREQG